MWLTCWLVGFHGISNLESYSSPNTVVIYNNQYMVVTVSFGGLVADQMQYYLERAQYL